MTINKPTLNKPLSNEAISHTTIPYKTMPYKTMPHKTTSSTLSNNPFHKKALYARSITLLTLFCTLSLLSYAHSQRSDGVNWTVLAIQSLPLLSLLPGLIKNYYRAYSWLCFIVLLYFIFAVLGAFKSTANALDYIFLVLIVNLFVTSMMASRWLQRELKFSRSAL